MAGETAIIEEFRRAMAEHGIVVNGEIVADGKLHRVYVDGDRRGCRNGWLILHLDGKPAGAFGCNRRYGSDAKFTWSAKSTKPLSPEERRAFGERIERQRAERDAEERRRREAAAQHAQIMWKQAAECVGDDHPYLKRKGVKSHGLRVGPWEKLDDGAVEVVSKQALLIPIRDIKKGIHSLQAIFPSKQLYGDRDKDFVKGGAKAGLFYTFGKPQTIDVGGQQRQVIMIGEGYATCATAHEVTGHAAIVAFDAGNLPLVAQVIRARFPEAMLVLLADNDRFTLTPIENPGVHQASKAAAAVGGVVAIPQFAHDVDGKPTDFNDLQQLCGADAVRRVIEEALNPPVAEARERPQLVSSIREPGKILPIWFVPSTSPAALRRAEFAADVMVMLDEAQPWRLDPRGVMLRTYGGLDGLRAALEEVGRLMPDARLRVLIASELADEAASVAHAAGASVEVLQAGESWVDSLWAVVTARTGLQEPAVEDPDYADPAALEAAAEVGGAMVNMAGLLASEKFDAWNVWDDLCPPALAQAIQQALDARTTQQAVATQAPAPEMDALAELGICALGMLGEHLVFWRGDCKRVLLLRPGELGRHQGLQRLAPNERWEIWAGGDFKPQQASNALIQICTAIGRVDLGRVNDAPYDEVNAAFMQARAIAMPSPVALAELLALDGQWRDAIFFDEFAGRAACTMTLPCGGAAGALLDEHDDLAAAFLGSMLGVDVSSKQAHDALNLLAKQNPRNLLHEYLNGLRWDGAPRLARWLIDYAGSPDEVFVRAVSAKMLIAAVARAFDPGVKVDTCLVLEGAQGVKKSSLIAALVPNRAWFAEDLAGAMDNKDALQGLSGKWLIELSELAATRKSTIEEVKSFLTRRVDNFRAPYGRRVADHPRQCVFFGSVNPAADGSWLFDATGGRRFWPVHVVRTDITKLEQVRDQLWAEAVHAYRQGQQHWLTDAEEALAAQEQKARLQENPWDSALDNYIASPQYAGEVAGTDVFAFSQGRAPTNRDSGELRHIAAALKARGWINRQTGPGRRARWYPPESTAF